MSRRLFAIFLALVFASGCSHVQRAKGIEEGTEVPYQSLGTLEVKKSARLQNPETVFWNFLEVLTLSLIDSPSKGELYKQSLRSELARTAQRKYGADDVIQVTYWPDPESGKFPSGLIFARGEMIRYQKFPKVEAPAAAQPAPAPEPATPMQPPAPAQA